MIYTKDMNLVYFAEAASNSGESIGWLQIAVPAVIGLLTATLGTWGFLSRYREKVDQLEKINCQQRLSTLEGTLAALQAQVSTLQQSSPSNYVQAHSPISLTENGKILLDESGSKKYIDDNFDKLLSLVQEKLISKGEDYSAYDVQEAASNVIKEQADDKNYIPIKDYAFSKGHDLNNIQLVGGVYLRDKALESLGFDIESYYASDGDGHDHKKK